MPIYSLQDFEVLEGESIEARPFYVSNDLVVVLVTLQPRARVPEHEHAHHDEVFDVVRGTGTFFLGDEQVSFGPGMSIVVPAGTRHGLLAGDDLWILRETVHRHVYARQAIGRALAKRLGRGIRKRDA
jgi:quercetin dioxygenase-like cupin family protein